MTITRSQKLKTIQKSTLNKKSAILDDEFIKRAKGITVRLNRINLADFDRKRVAYCSIQLDRKDFNLDGELRKRNTNIFIQIAYSYMSFFLFFRCGC